METIVLKTFDSTFSANIMLGKLENEGIRGYLRDEFTVGVNPLLSNAVGGVKLAVDVKDADEALRILTLFEQARIRDAVCPVCNQKAFAIYLKPVEPNIVVSLLSKLFGKKPAEETLSIYKCGHCKYETETLSVFDEEEE